MVSGILALPKVRNLDSEVKTARERNLPIFLFSLQSFLGFFSPSSFKLISIEFYNIDY